MSKPLSTAELLALAVLRGDLEAALPLADCLLEEHGQGGKRLAPVHKITCPLERIRVVAFVDRALGADIEIDRPGFRAAIEDWLRGSVIPLVLTGIDHIEVYELPAQPPLIVPMPEEQVRRLERLLEQTPMEENG